MNHLSLGKKGEKIAANYLIANGYKVFDSNYYNKKGYRIGEIDLIAENKGEIIFIEVKARKGNPRYVVPEENITAEKLRKLNKSIQFFLRKNEYLDKNWRLDSISIIFDFYTRKLSLKHLKHIRLN